MAEPHAQPARSRSPGRRAASSPASPEAPEQDTDSEASCLLGHANPRRPLGRAPQGVRGGSFEYYQAMKDTGIREGFDSIARLAAWPKEELLAIFGNDSPPGATQRRRRFESILQYGMMLHTDFSGKGSVEQAMRMLAASAEDLKRERKRDARVSCHASDSKPDGTHGQSHGSAVCRERTEHSCMRGSN
eukprot:11154829-Lingulodinium_polyedra.AAC.1